MELDSNDIISLILSIRDPQKVNFATSQLLQFLHIPQSIFILFQIISNPEINDFVYQYTIISISEYCKINNEIFDQDHLNLIRSNLINILISTDNESHLSILLGTISNILKLFPSDWPEIQELAFSPNFNAKIGIRIELLIILIPYLTDDIITSQMNFFRKLFQILFQSDDIYCQCSSVSLMVQIVQRSQNIELVAQLQPCISNLLHKVIFNTNFNVKLLNNILNPIDENQRFDLDLIDFNFAIDLALNSIAKKEIPLYFKVQINNILVHCLRFDKCQISYDVLKRILIIEFNLTLQLHASEQDNFRSWIYDVGNVIDCIFLQIPSQQVIQIVKTNFYSYYKSQNNGARFFQLLFLHELAIIEIPNIENLFIELLPQIIEFLLQDPSPSVKNFSAVVLAYIVPFIKTHIIDNMEDILQIANQFVIIHQNEYGTFLLESIIKCLNDTDEIIVYEFNFVKEMLLSSDTIVCNDSMKILKLLIENSQKEYISIEEEAYCISAKLLNDDLSRFSYLLIFLSILLAKSNRLHDRLPEFLMFVNIGLKSQDYSIMMDSLYAVFEYFKRDSKIIGSDESIQLSGIIFPSIISIATLPNDDNFTISLKGMCSQVLLALIYATRVSTDLLSFYFQCANNYLLIDNKFMIYWLAKSTLMLPSLIQKNKELAELMVNNEFVIKIMRLLILKIITNFTCYNNFDDTLIPCVFISIEIFGFEKLQIGSDLIAQYILTELRYYMDIRDVDKKIIQMLSKGITDLIDLSPDQQTGQQIIQFFMPYLINFLKDQSDQKHQVIAISSLSLLLKSTNSQMIFDEQFCEQIIQEMISFIGNNGYKLPKSACKLFFSILDTNKVRIQPFAPLIVNTLLQRFDSIQDQQYQSVSLREMLIITLCKFEICYDRLIPIKQLVRICLSVLPLTNKMKYSAFIYSSVNSFQLTIQDDPELCLGLYKVYVLVISDRNKESMYLQPFLLYLMAYFISRNDGLFESEEEKNMFIAQIFGNDSIALQNYINMYPSYLEESKMYVCPEVDEKNVQYIDLTNQIFD